jgi:tetratricopeptide (TPR) repeat protein
LNLRLFLLISTSLQRLRCFLHNLIACTMENKNYLVENYKPFADSLIWQFNRDYYEKAGISAWRESTVPHQLTSNSMVGKTYAELILGFLKDLEQRGQTAEKVYILELGSGHGRLAFHILKHLDRLIELSDLQLPSYCYILSDIVEENLSFFSDHPQLQPWFESGNLDVAYFDGVESKELILRKSGMLILPYQLDQPLIAIANYFFDSIPNDLFYIQQDSISDVSIALQSTLDPTEQSMTRLLESLQLNFKKTPAASPVYDIPPMDAILEVYKSQVPNSYLFFPNKGIQCIDNLRLLSNKGLMVLSIDKGYSELHDLKQPQVPEIITHGSFSVWVNFHAIKTYCSQQGGTALLPGFSTFHLQLACLLFVPESESYTATNAAYQGFVNDFGPDDMNSLKKFTYKNMHHMQLVDLLAILRLSNYDSTFFENLLPRIRATAQRITTTERTRLAQALHQTWQLYFTLKEPFDMAYELGGVFYDLGYYQDALDYFNYSVDIFGPKADIYYNKALCYYQLRQDGLFGSTLKEAKAAFPAFEGYKYLDTLDLGAV